MASYELSLESAEVGTKEVLEVVYALGGTKALEAGAVDCVANYAVYSGAFRSGGGIINNYASPR